MNCPGWCDPMRRALIEVVVDAAAEFDPQDVLGDKAQICGVGLEQGGVDGVHFFLRWRKFCFMRMKASISCWSCSGRSLTSWIICSMSSVVSVAGGRMPAAR